MTIANGILDASALSDLGAGAAARFGEYASIGDSIVAGGFAGAPFSKRVMHRSAGRYRQRNSFAVGGTRTDQILATQVPQLIASGQRLAIINGGTNDIEQSVPEATIRANLISIWAALRQAGIDFIDVGVMPRDSSTSLALNRANHEIWRALYCARNGIKHVNPLLLLGTPSGGWVSGTNFDAVHPGPIGADIVADAVISALDQRFTISPLLELIDRAAASSVVYANAVGFGGAGSALPSGWFSGTTGATYSVVAPDSGQQNLWLRSTFAGAATDAGFNGTGRNTSDLGMATGDTVAFGCLLRWTATSPTALKPRLAHLNTGLTNIVNLPFDDQGGAAGEAIYSVYGEHVVGSGATFNTNFRATTTDAGYFEISRPILFNLTANGLA